jgi:hypothetical protein
MEMTSEDEAYDPWPGCYMDSTGCHYAIYYSDTYILNEKFANFSFRKDTQFIHLYFSLYFPSVFYPFLFHLH